MFACNPQSVNLTATQGPRSSYKLLTSGSVDLSIYRLVAVGILKLRTVSLSIPSPPAVHFLRIGWLFNGFSSPIPPAVVCVPPRGVGRASSRVRGTVTGRTSGILGASGAASSRPLLAILVVPFRHRCRCSSCDNKQFSLTSGTFPQRDG